MKDISQFVEPETEWVNYGDVNPKIHGGQWVRYVPNSDVWQIVKTFVWADVMPEGSEEIGIEKCTIYPDDVFIDENPENGPTEALEWVIDQFKVSYETAIVDNPIEYYLADLPMYADYGCYYETIEPENYWSYLEEKYGITPDMA